MKTRTIVYEVKGTITSAGGLLGATAVGEPVAGILAITGEAADFEAPVGKSFLVAAELTTLPYKERFRAKDLRCSGIVWRPTDALYVEAAIDNAKVRATLAGHLPPGWGWIDNWTVTATPKNWFYSMLVCDAKGAGSGTKAGDTTTEDPAPQPEPDPQPDPQPDPEPQPDELANAKWLDGKDACAGAAVDVTLRSCGHDGDKFRFDYSPRPVPWDGDGTRGDTYFFRRRDGRMVGGKFDHLRPGQTVKGDENIRGGYHGHTTPAKGERCLFCLVSDCRKRRSNLVEVVW